MQPRDAHPASPPDPASGAADVGGAHGHGLPPRPRQEARRPHRHHVRRHAAWLRPAERPHQRRQVHEAAPLPALRIPQQSHPHAH
uniref:Uncharacterized protein n=1 Tax=Arundo donax TaxID=35708 RepID=A0A0A9H3H7_ARUDO